MNTPLRRRLASLLLAALTASSAALAQQPTPIEQSIDAIEDGRGLPLLRPMLSVSSDASALNPAAFSFLPEAQAAYLYSASDSGLSGHGLFAATPVFAGLALGASAEFLAPGSDVLMRRYQLAASWAYGDALALGVRYRFFGSESSLDIDEFGAVDLGVILRYLPWVSASLVVEHVDTPRFDDTWIAPVVRAGLGTSLLDGRLDIDAFYATTTEESDGIGNFGLTLRGAPTDGLHLVLTGYGGDEPIRWGGGLELTQGFFSLSLGAYAQVDPDTADIAFDGFAVSLEARSEARPSLYRASDRWIRLALPGSLDERAPRSPFGVAGRSFAELLLALDAIAEDPSIDGVLLEIDGLSFGFSQLYEMRSAIDHMRDEGIRVVAHLRDTSTRSYYLASAADRVYSSAALSFDTRGLSTTLTYLKGSLDFLGVEPEFVKIDRYKTAPEMFLRRGPSPEATVKMNLYLDAIFDEMIAAIAASRGTTDQAVRALFDAAPLTPPEAEAAGFIDGVLFRDELPERLRADFDLSAPPRLEDGYARPPGDAGGPWSAPEGIAIIYVDGAIIRGESIEAPILGSMSTGSETIATMLQYAVASPDIRAIVLRVDSPGGSAFASDLMYRAIERAAKAKPVIVSMSNVAASGGYYVAAPGHHILATPMTLTGSIGIYSGKFDLSRLFSMLGISRVLFSRGRFADLYSPASGWTDAHRERARASITYLYDIFVERVSEGRGMTPEAVRSIGEGHVWPGRIAQQNGLVDELGGLLDALDAAKARAGLEPDARLRIIQLPPRGPFSAFKLPGLDSIIQTASGQDAPPAPRRVQALELLLERLGALPTALLFDPSEPLLLLPFDWTLE